MENRMPIRYMAIITDVALWGKKCAAKNAYTGILAVHDMKGVSRMVSLRSRALGSVRLAITLGTEQPKPMSRGTILRPDRPIFLSRLSITKAMRAI